MLQSGECYCSEVNNASGYSDEFARVTFLMLSIYLAISVI